MPAADPLSLFLPPVAAWFRQTLGTPTPAQMQGWPAIASGRNTLILAPTGSGKTLAAFLACLDQLWRQTRAPWGVQVLYVSPLKALNNDIHKNLQVPLEGVSRQAEKMGWSLPAIRTAVRTGDTPTRDRIRFLRDPPQVLITTPESLHLLLTSQARDALRSVRWCIVDEIHALCPNKRGVFLALLLERLEELTPDSFVRIGLSATQQPLAEVARYLGGQRAVGDGTGWQPREVHIVDAGLGKPLDLQVHWPVESFPAVPERSVWPSVHRLLLDLIRSHRSTLVFANNRRTVERLTTHLNELADAGQAAPAEAPLARAHHGSIALEVRQQTEQALKEGRLKAVVATASLELGIDMGSVELVCQVESPGSVARGLQRVGRAGHVVGQCSKGRLIAKTLPDLVEQAVLAREMAAGRVEAIQVPRNCLDILAQQLVALVATDPWKPADLYALVRRAYPFCDLSPELFERVLEMITGRYPDQAFRDLRPRVSWDRVHDVLRPLPGSRHLAVVNGGAIPDSGQYPVYVAGERTRIGELDEEFIFERRLGDVFVLGTTAWRIEEIEADRVLVSRVEGMPALTPFWRGEGSGRSRELGLAVGRFLRELLQRLPQDDLPRWLERECFVTPSAARCLLDYIRRQVEEAGCVPCDRTIVVEAFRDPLGDWYVAVLSPFGSRFHLTLRLAVEARLRQRLGYPPQCLHHDDGLLLRVADMEEPPLDLLEDLSPEDLESTILGELDNSPLFALRFRQNAARALLLPRLRPDQRAPLWLQRLKGRTLLQIARKHPSFPILLETYRECLHDHFDLEGVRQVLADIAAGKIEVVQRRADAPSPFAASLLFDFTAAFLYESDRVDPDGEQASRCEPAVLEQLLHPGRMEHLLDPRAVAQVERRLRGLGRLPRNTEEAAEWLRRLGDVAPQELPEPVPRFLAELEAQGLACRIHLAGAVPAERWILCEEAALYASAFGLPVEASQSGPAAGGSLDPHQAAAAILRRFLDTHALVSLEDLAARYPVDRSWAAELLQRWVQEGSAVSVTTAEAPSCQFAAPANLEQVQHTSLALHRREVLSCTPSQFAAFLLRWQHVHPESRLAGKSGLDTVLEQLEGLALPTSLWEQTVLPSRLQEYHKHWLDELIRSGDWIWIFRREEDGPGRVSFWQREQVGQLDAPQAEPSWSAPSDTEAVYERLRRQGAQFVIDLSQGLRLMPTQVRRALWNLVCASWASNDSFDVLRRGEAAFVSPHETASHPRSFRRRPAGSSQEGRWSLIPYGMPSPEEKAVRQAQRLLRRYGVVTRELAEREQSLVSWRILYEILSRMEWAGQVRRGYFVEGLSGAQFALPEAARELSQLRGALRASAPVVLVHSLDPANVLGICESLPALVPRRLSNWLVVRDGRAVLGVEGHGKRLYAPPDASTSELIEAARCLAKSLWTYNGFSPRGKIRVQFWNARPVLDSPGRQILEAAGFVHDDQALVLYRGFGAPPSATGDAAPEMP
jgi:ATP-dependent Lhr-like helicase